MQLLAPLRHRDFALLFAGGTLSFIGDGIYLVAIAFQVLELSNSATSLSLVLLCWSVGMVPCLPLAGALVDRWDRRAVLIVADSAALLATATLGMLSIAGQIDVWHCAAVAGVIGICSAFQGPALQPLMQALLPLEDAVAATALKESSLQASLMFIGPAAGGVLVAAIGPGPAFLIDAATFAASIVCVVLIRSPAAPQPRQRVSIAADILEGVAYVRSQPWLWAPMMAASVAMMGIVGATQVALPYVIKNDWGGGAEDYGLLLAVSGASALVVALLVGHFGLPQRPVAAMVAGFGLGYLAVAGYGLAGSVLAATIFAVLRGVQQVGEVIWFTLQIERVPSHLLGRVSSLDFVVWNGLMPVSFAASGPLVEAIGAQATFIGGGVLGGAAFLVIYLLVPDLREARRAPAGAPATPA